MRQAKASCFVTMTIAIEILCHWHKALLSQTGRTVFLFCTFRRTLCGQKFILCRIVSSIKFLSSEVRFSVCANTQLSRRVTGSHNAMILHNAHLTFSNKPGIITTSILLPIQS
ncbi:hypothetical protein BJV78DRAFT_195818 [Lactifluus subvellereus]|nr:hypothetical protein BJV78DRAFT_195818 [Lactifluus subvellereus]